MNIKFKDGKIQHKLIKLNSSIACILPIFYLQQLGLSSKDSVLISLNDNKIIIEKEEE